MDFFERQASAKRKTSLLVALFAVALAAILLAVLAVVWVSLAIVDYYQLVGPETTDGGGHLGFLNWLTSPGAAWSACLTLAVIGGGSLWRLSELAKGGGQCVAEMMGGTPVEAMEPDRQTRQLVQVIEEMAVAAGVARPGIYVLDSEPGLNAFAAGNDTEDAVIAVTRGLLDTLERDELQGVMGHEMSHILNADTRINMRLLAIMAGITLIGQMGLWFWRIMIYDAVTPSRHRGGGSAFRHRLGVGGGSGRRGLGGLGGLVGLFVAAVGALLLIVIGWIGVIIARLIKAAVSRRRELLADAAAVQFTRHPDGIASALLKIRNAGAGTALRSRHAEEISHMGLCRISSGLTRLTATHPPIAERMAALGIKYKHWYRQNERANRDAKRSQADEAASTSTADPTRAGDPHEGGGAGPVAGLSDTSNAPAEALSVAAMAALAGSIQAQGLQQARRMLARLPQAVHDTLRSPNGARHVVLASLMHGPDHARADRRALPDDQRDTVTGLRDLLVRAYPGTEPGTIDASVRLPLLELALPALQRLDTPQRDACLAAIDTLIRANDQMSIFEFAARTLIKEQWRDHRQRGIGTHRLDQHAPDLRVVLSLLAHAGHSSDDRRVEAYGRAVQALGAGDTKGLLRLSDCTLTPFCEALQGLDDLQPRHKRRLIHGAAECVAADGVIQPGEADLLRVVAATLHVPLPLPGNQD